MEGREGEEKGICRTNVKLLPSRLLHPSLCKKTSQETTVATTVQCFVSSW